jgi:hypothetical protein
VAIQPIDLQTLYAQLDKIGKSQVQQQAATQAARDAEMQTNKNDADQKLKSVQTAEAGDEKAGVVHERDGSGKEEGESAGKSPTKKPEKDEENAESEKEIIRDPALGSHIDISG